MYSENNKNREIMITSLVMRNEKKIYKLTNDYGGNCFR